MHRILAAVSLCAALAGCDQFRQVQQLGEAKTQVETAVSVVRSDAPTMTKAQAAACAGQSALNALTTYLRARGHGSAADYSSIGSAMAGGGCEWRETVVVR